MSYFVSIHQPELDLETRAVNRLLAQFKRSPMLIAVLLACIKEISALQKAIIDVINLRGVNDASGVNLDAIGRIVGQDRSLLNVTQLLWFAPDSLNCCDKAPVFVENAMVNGVAPATDYFYRQLITARILRNFSRYSSIPELQQVVKLALGININFTVVGPMEVNLIVDSTITPWMLTLLLGQLSNSPVQGAYFLPIAATVAIHLVFLPTLAFMPDSISNCCDVGKAAVRI